MNSALHAAFELAQGEFTLSLELELVPGEIVVLVGPSGGGKSTGLRAIAGLARPRSGRIEIGGQVVFDAGRRLDLPPWKRRVGYVFQDYALFPHLTVEQNIRYGLRGVPEARSRVDEWLQALNIADLARRKPGELSGGQQQRVALARAAARDADILLLDEPFGALDAATRRSVRAELQRFLQRVGRASLLVSHDYLDALTLGDRLAVLEGGRITQLGTREEVVRRPRTPFLAELTGHNVLEGTASGPAPAGEMQEVRVNHLVFHVAAAPVAAGPVFVAFGPQEVALLRADPADRSLSARNRFMATVREIVPLPDRLRVYLDVGVSLVADVVAEAASELGLRPGARLVVAIKATAIELYR